MKRSVARRRPALSAALLLLALLALPAGAVGAAQPAKPYWWANLQTQAQRDGYRLIRPAELKKLYDQGEPMTVIDARTVFEFRAGHLPGACNVEFHMGHTSRLDPATEEKLRKALGPDPGRRVVIYDRGLQCVRSQLACQWAVSLGHQNVWHLAEGWMGWVALTQTQGARSAPQAGAGDGFPDERFTLLGGDRDRSYLSLGHGTADFRLGQLPADYLLVELYNELCFTCCQSVGELNRLLGLINREPALAGRLKMMGVGVGNLQREVNRFRREKGVDFPLFSDQGRELHQRLGQPDLPVLYLVMVRGASALQILAVETGPFGKAEELLARLKKRMSSAPGR